MKIKVEINKIDNRKPNKQKNRKNHSALFKISYINQEKKRENTIAEIKYKKMGVPWWCHG